ncbi:alpha/beta hydrolase [Longimycelium tulufanense]|uniref:Alpha/beta hydrolase n=1 Tax=Longimycelium tulufanense TaxID=907463 RepID=A0A8J3CEK8_9PSEU|nr:alpha/beta hydrolase [Longimycelium tulufanense]
MQKVRFEVDGATVVGTLRHPGTDGPVPIVVMAHGFALLAANGLEPFAQRFAELGLAVLTFDYRGFGPSGGELRQDVDPWRQLDDWRAAIRFARAVPGVDPAKVVLWGTSFSGGHVLELGSEDPNLAAVVSQVPHVSGRATVLAIPVVTAAKLTVLGVVDCLGGALGREPVYTKSIGRPGETAGMNQPGSYEGYTALIEPDSGWRNQMTARIALKLPFFSPNLHAARSTVPTFIGVAVDDRVTPAKPARKLAKRMGAELHEYPGGHFDVYRGEGFDRIVADEVAFLRAKLGLPATRS